MNSLKFKVNTLIVFVIFILLSSTPAVAAVEWSDNFNDDDISDWRISGERHMSEVDYDQICVWPGDALVHDDYLSVGGNVSADYEDGLDHDFTWMEHQSTTEFGSWSLDFKYDNPEFAIGVVLFADNSIVLSMGDDGDIIHGHFDIYGMAVVMVPAENYVQFVTLDGELTDLVWHHQYKYEDWKDDWNSFKVEREGDIFSLYINDDNVVNFSTKLPDRFGKIFALYGSAGTGFDNVRVVDSYKSNTLSLPYTAGVLALGLIVSFAIVTLKNRKS